MVTPKWSVAIVMKQYPSIEGPKKAPRQPCIAFEKLDGSNLRFEWSKKRGWYKFGSRTQLVDATHPVFGCAWDLFLKEYADPLAKVFIDRLKRDQGMVAFCEFFGPHSEFGAHSLLDQKEIVLFDVWEYKHGLLKPSDFLHYFGNLKVPRVIYRGNLNEEFIQAVRDGKYPVKEGVVCKGEDWMCKIKTNEYLARLRTVFKTGWEKHWE